MRFRRCLAVLGMSALGTGCASRDLYFPLEHVAGSGVVYWNLAHHQSLLGPHHGTTSHLGACRVDLVKREATFVKGLRVYGPGRYDRRGRHFETLGPGNRDVVCFEPGKGRRLLATGGSNQNLDLVVAQDRTWLYWIRDTGYPHAERPLEVFRMSVDTGRIDTLPLPPGFGRARVGDQTLSAQDGSVVYVVDTQPGPRSYRTWRGDFQTGRWSEPIEGSFRVIDAQGTLLEQHEYGASLEIIRGGRRGTVDLGLGGFVEPVFGTGYVRRWDKNGDQYVFRSLNGEPDFRVPRRPPPYPQEPELQGPPALDWPESVAPTRP